MLLSGPTTTSFGWLNWPVGVAGLASDAQAHDFALGPELVDLDALGAGLVAREIGDPYVALLVHRDAVRR